MGPKDPKSGDSLMGDSTHVLPQCDSPRGMFLSTRTDSYQKALQSLKNVRSFFKIRLAVPPEFGGPATEGMIAEGYDIRWQIFSQSPFPFLIVAFTSSARRNPDIACIWIFLGFIIHFVALYSVMYWHRDMPFQLIGAKAKFMIEVIPMASAAALNYFEFDYEYYFLVLSCSTYVYAYAHCLHRAYDIGGMDVLLGVVMQVLCYVLDGGLLVRALAWSFCFGLSFYRYMTYCAPVVPAHSKKEVEQLPC